MEGPSEPEADVEAIIDAAGAHPWTSKQLPPIAEWVAANQKPLDLIVEASRRPRYYSPSPTFLDDQQDMLITMLLPGAQAVRGGVRGLTIRAMQNIGENRLDAAWQDIMAMYRLSSLITQGPTIVEQLVGWQSEESPSTLQHRSLNSDQLTKELATQIQQDLAKIPLYANIADSVDGMERISGLDAVLYTRVHGFDALSDTGISGKKSSPMAYAAINWNVVMKQMNGTYDQLVAAMRLPQYEDRKNAFADFESELTENSESDQAADSTHCCAISRNSRSELVSSIIEAQCFRP